MNESPSKSSAGLAVFRMLFGALCAFAMLRGLSLGWIDSFYREPSFFFSYWGFAWLKPLSPDGMLCLYIATALLAAMICVGLYFKFATLMFTIIFSYIELCDVSNYLNHYYLVSLLAFLLFLTPANSMWSVDSWRKPAIKSSRIPKIFYTLLRLQIAVVYFFAALAKCSEDWLIRAQPMSVWLKARSDMPLLGSLFDEAWVAYVFSWAGFLFDATIVAWLLSTKTRRPAYLAVIGFHVLTALLFPIGIFPWLMIISTTLFFTPSWPLDSLKSKAIQLIRDTVQIFSPRERFATSTTKTTAQPPRPHRQKSLRVFAVFYFLLQIAIPLRHHLYEGNVLWNELGMRWSWRVMASEKNGDTHYTVRFNESEKNVSVSPNAYLTIRQAREISGQPDLILQLGHHIGKDYEARYKQKVSVYTDSFASLNGRPAARLIDPKADLMKINDTLRNTGWILPLAQRSTSKVIAKR